MFKKTDLINILGEVDGDWYDRGCPISLKADADEWKRRDQVYEKVEQAEKNGKLIRIETVEYKAPKVMIVSDDLGMQGVLNPADGKKYDSKSAYYKSVKDQGLEIVGDDAPRERAKPKQNYIDWEQAVSETLKTNPLKGN